MVYDPGSRIRSKPLFHVYRTILCPLFERSSDRFRR